MPKFPSSIRQKIILGYILSFSVIIIGGIFTYSDLRIIKNKIVLSKVASELFETTLEIRRFEKNYFLYKEEEDYVELLRFVDDGDATIEINKGKFKGLVSEGSILNLQKAIKEYRDIIVNNKTELQTGNDLEINVEHRVRRKGRELVEIAENIVSIERMRIQALLSKSQYFIMASMFFLIIMGIGFGYVLLRTVTKPLKLLEETMGKISSGQMEKVLINSSDKEIVLFSQAFNRTLREIELRHMGFIAQSEKLASLGTMVSGVAHQLNNPLSNISTSCQILLEEIEGCDVNTIKEVLQQIEGQVERIRAMVYSLLEFSKKKEFKNELLPLRDLIEDIIRLMRGDIPTRVELTVDIPEDIYIIADKQRMQGAILNILKNAIDAIPDEGKVFISAKEYKDTKTMEIKIQDTGLGIDPKDSKKIFEPFFTTKGHGTGLGLFVTREIIQEHGGTITMDSVIGQGTTFTIKLPAKEI
jgi:signal transduction histidine kinase